MIYKYKHAILGGTFDRFHLGHQSLIKTAFEQSEKVTIGITTAELIKAKHLSNKIEDYLTRENSIKKYLKEKQFLKRSSLIPLYDIYGNSLAEKDIQAIFVTIATFHKACLINIKRKEIAFKSLEIITISFLKGADGKIITSERIRKGEIDRNGQRILKEF